MPWSVEGGIICNFVYSLPISHFQYAIKYCRENIKYIPVTFMLGFYLTLIMGRWWEQLMLFPWPETTCFYIMGYVEGTVRLTR
jgi:hypothetical protein